MKLNFSSQAALFAAWAAAIKPEDWQPFKCKSWGETHLFCDGPSVYSYGKHFELGRHIHLDGVHHVLLNQARYSITTTNHQRGVQRHTRNYNQIFVPDAEIIFNSREEAFAESAKVDSVWIDAVAPFAEALQNKRITTLHRYMAQMERIKEQADGYYSAYGLSRPCRLVELLAVGNNEEVKSRAAEHKAQQEKLGRCYKEFYHFERINHRGTEDKQVELKILSIAFMGDAKVKSIRKLPEEKIKELALRTGFNPAKPYGY